jgi:hypothetical protein
VKYHDIGEPGSEHIDPMALSGLDVDSLELSQQPSLEEGTIFLVTQAGVAKWQVPDALKNVKLHPRKSFLKFACGGKLDSLAISGRGYWVAQREGIVGCFSSHDIKDPQRQVYNVPGTVIAVVDAARLVSALRSVLVLCEKTDKVEVSSDKGVACRDRFGNEATFSLGTPSAPWGKFIVTGLIAEFLVAVLGQSPDKEAAIQNISPVAVGPAMRISRGAFDVDFRVLG